MSNEEEKNTAAAAAPAGPARVEKGKHFALLSGVIFFIALIVILWALNAANLFQKPVAKQTETFDVNKFSQEFSKAFREVGAKMSSLKEIDRSELEKLQKDDPQIFSKSSTTYTNITPQLKK